MIAVACHALFVSAAALALTTIVTTIAPQRARIAQLLLRGPEWTVGA
jgi:hypothetical protein